MFFTFLFLDTIVFYASFLELLFLYLGERVDTGSCRAHSLTLSMPLSLLHISGLIGQYFTGTTCYECGQLASEGERAQGGGGFFWWARAVRTRLGSGPDSRMAHLTLSPYISWSPCVAGGRSLLPPPSLSSQPTPAEQLDFGYRRFIQVQSHMSMKM